MTRKLAIVMAAGQGKRMGTDLPKVVVPICGRPMIDYVLDTLAAAGVDHVLVVVGHKAEVVREVLASRTNVTFVEQRERLGTGHAVMMCRDALQGHTGPVLVVAGDSPLMQHDSIAALFAEVDRSQPACLLGTTRKDDPTGLGRILRDAAGNFVGIVEEKDATPEQRKVTEVNMSTYLFSCPDLLYALDHIRNDNQQGEYYLTDCPGVLKAAGRDVRALAVLKPIEALSINTLDELAVAEQAMRGLTTSGVTTR